MCFQATHCDPNSSTGVEGRPAALVSSKNEPNRLRCGRDTNTQVHQTQWLISAQVTHHPPDLALEDMAKKMLELGSATPRRKGGGEEL